MSNASKQNSGEPSVGSGSGTTAYLHTETRGRLGLGVVAGALLLAWGYLSQLLPPPSHAVNALVSASISLTLIALIVWAMLPLTRAGRRLPMVTPFAFAAAIVLVRVDLVAAANICKIVGAAALGLWLSTEILRLSWVVLVALVGTAVDTLSVAFGPTKEILEEGPQLVGYFTVAFPWLGNSLHEVYSAIGVSDVVFFAMYVGCASGFSLRPRASAVAMMVAVLATFGVALWWRVLPALPSLSLAFLAVNIDYLRDDAAWNRPNREEVLRQNRLDARQRDASALAVDPAIADSAPPDEAFVSDDRPVGRVEPDEQTAPLGEG